MRRRLEGRGDRSKDAAEGTPVKSEMEEENDSIVAMKEKNELNDMRDDLNGMKTELSDVRSGLDEIKGLLARLTEEKFSEGKGGFEPKEPKEETGDNQQGSRQQSPQPKPNSKKGHGRLDRETLAQLCWDGAYATHRKSASVDASNATLETIALLSKPLTKIKMEVFGDLQSTYELSRSYEGMCQAEKRVPLLMRMDPVLQKMVYQSEFNAHWTSETEWAGIPNEAILHVLRLESLPRSKSEVLRLLDGVAFPGRLREESTIVEKYRTAFPAYLMEYKKAYSYIMMAEEEQLYERMKADPLRSIPLRDASQKLSRELLPMPGLISRLTAKIPDDLWAAYYDHPMAFDLAAVRNSDDFVMTLDCVLQSWLDIRRDVDSSAYMHKELLQRTRTLVPKITTERTRSISSIDPASLDATNHDLDSNPPAAPQPAEDSDVDTVALDNADALEYGNPTHLVAIEMAGYLMDPTDMVGPDNPYAETLRCVIQEEGYSDASIQASGVHAAYQPVPTHGSSQRIAQRIGGPPVVDGRTTGSAAKPRFVRICYEMMFKGSCNKRECRYCHDEQVIKAFVKAHPERYVDSPYHPSKLRG